MIYFVDLPKLTSILNVSSGSFQNIHMLILQSSSKSLLLWRLDIPNLENVELSGSFRYVQSKSISSIVWMMLFHLQMCLPFLWIVSKPKDINSNHGFTRSIKYNDDYIFSAINDACSKPFFIIPCSLIKNPIIMWVLFNITTQNGWTSMFLLLE